MWHETVQQKQEIIPKKTNDWKNSHPAAGNNNPHQTEVIQFTYRNTRVVNIRSVCSAIHRSTNSAVFSRANKRQRQQIKVVKRSVILTEVNGEQPTNLSSCGLTVEATTSLARSKWFKCVQEVLLQLETVVNTKRTKS